MIAGIDRESIRHWQIDDRSADLAREVGCSPLIASLLQMRGEAGNIDTRSWLSPGLSPLLDTLDHGFDLSFTRDVFERIGKGSRVVVYGDYDVDGVSATTLAARLCSLRQAEVGYFIPHRHQEGYGLHEKVVRRIARRGCDFLIAVDCGTSNSLSLETAAELGINVLVFDHHLPHEAIVGKPSRSVLVNPHLGGGEEARTLCGTAVLWVWAWKTAVADRTWLIENLGLVALATVADCVPLGPLNRALVREGLLRIREGREPGLNALSSKLGLELKDLDSETLAMKLIPCLNAPGRLELADLSVKVLSTEPPVEKSVEELVALNRRRQGLTAKILEEVTPLLEKGRCHVAGKADWPVGVLSGVASRICSEMGRPVALAAPVDSRLIRGTLRVPKGGDAVSILKGLSSSLHEWGGHKQAAGFSVERERWPDLMKTLEAKLAGLEFQAEEVDVLDIHPAELTLDKIDEIETLGPFGIGNPSPLFYVSHNGSDRFLPLGRTGQHLRIEIGGVSIVAFRSAGLEHEADPVEGWIYRARKNTWRGRSRVELFLEKPVLCREDS